MGVYLEGDVVSESIYVGGTGLTFTRLASYVNGSAVSWSPTFTEIGSGFYRWSYTTTQGDTTGAYEWVGTASDGTPVPINFDLNPRSVSATVGVAGAGGVSRKSLRREIGRELGQCIVLTAESGTDTTLVDRSRLTYPNNAYKGRTLYFTGGTAGNIGETRTVIASTQSSGQIEWSEALPAAVAAADEAELWGMHGEGVEPWEVNDMINTVVLDVGYNYGTPVTAAVAAAFDYEDPEITIPAAVTRMIYSLQYQPDGTDLWLEVDRATSPGGAGYWVNRGLGTITVGGDYWLSELDDLDLQIVGDSFQTALASDAATTAVPKEYLVAEVCARLCLAMLERSPELARARLQVFSQRAIMAKQRMPRQQPDAQRV